MLARHGLRFELARLLLQHGAGPLEVARKTGLEIEQLDHLIASDASGIGKNDHSGISSAELVS